MSDFVYDLRRVSHITAAAVGQPGQRTFYLQAQKGNDLVSLITEKELVRALCLRIDDILEELVKRGVARPDASEEPTPAELLLRPPLNPFFRIAQMALAYDPTSDLLVIEADELQLADDDEDEDIDPILQQRSDDEEAKNEPRRVRISATRAQMQALSRNAMDIITTGGRPICPQCLQPMEDEGHMCVKKNGHGNKKASEM
ncbi:DUF3090 domain-containing protein [Herpetosiphon geysericola]|uniref:DUF3090 domain-containing protein n=1 Tax=Herpetosiphon geysericola TaxID=70996 RepID=A0A0P6Y7Y8_9CHLR|nr:DUF3090 domain-containing protein [Herpetosiphon geysericola]KPL85952.1 hypothetical protein SE18_13705 [Herpetosiphon geysericola]